MKTTLLAITLLASTVVVGLAGEATSYQPVQTTAPSLSPYRAGECQIDVFGAYGVTRSGYERLIGDDAFGGGLGFNYYFTRHFGLGGEVSLLDAPGDVLGTTAVNVFLRLPVADTGLAFYGFAGGGISFNTGNLNSSDFSDARERVRDRRDPDDRNSDNVLLMGHAGVGVEYRITQNFGIFSDARYTWVERGRSDFGLIRAGLRFAF